MNLYVYSKVDVAGVQKDMVFVECPDGITIAGSPGKLTISNLRNMAYVPAANFDIVAEVFLS